MSFGFGIGDFVTVSNLTLTLYRAFKGAPGEFNEISAQLSSFHIVLADLQDQAANSTSLLHRHGTADLLGLVNNLQTTLRELEELFKRYQNMGQNAWLRMELGLQKLSALREKLTIHIGLINQYTSNLTLGALGRMEPMMVKLFELLQENMRQGGRRARTIVSASENEGPQTWEQLEIELHTEGISREYLQDNREEIRSLVSRVVEDMNNCEVTTEVLDLRRNIDNADAPMAPVRPTPALNSMNRGPSYIRQPPMELQYYGGKQATSSITFIDTTPRPGAYYPREPPSPEPEGCGGCFQSFCDVCCGCPHFTTR